MWKSVAGMWIPRHDPFRGMLHNGGGLNPAKPSSWALGYRRR